MRSLKDKLTEKIGKEWLIEDCDMREFTSFRAGGRADLLVMPQNLEELSFVLRELAKEDIPHLFERFYRGQNAGEGGIGIGLALAKEIVERQNGTISAKNRRGGGALFEIRFYCH